MLSIRLRYSLYKLRDDLRYSVIIGESPNDHNFSRFDKRLSVLIDREQFVTPWNIFRLKEDRLKEVDKFIENEKQFESTLKSSKYKFIHQMYQSHKKPLSDYISKKFWGFNLFIHALIYSTFILRRYIERPRKSEWLKTVSHRANDAKIISEHPVLLEYQCCCSV
jgi:hypothetical protein